MAKIFCFGDSNTYGYDARSMVGERLPARQRWVDILHELSGWEVINGGMNGRKIPRDSWAVGDFDRELSACGAVDLVLIMLGTNDLLMSFHPDIEKIGVRMERFARHVLEHPSVAGDGTRILLVAPPVTGLEAIGQDGFGFDEEAGKFAACYREIAGRLGLRFADAAAWNPALAHDGVHLAPEGHIALAAGLWRVLEKWL